MLQTASEVSEVSQAQQSEIKYLEPTVHGPSSQRVCHLGLVFKHRKITTH